MTVNDCYRTETLIISTRSRPFHAITVALNWGHASPGGRELLRALQHGKFYRKTYQ